MLCLVLHIFLLTVTSAQDAGVGAFWTQFSLSKLQFTPKSSSSYHVDVNRHAFTLTVNSEAHNTCIYDPVYIHWNTTSNYQGALELKLSDSSIAFILESDPLDNTPRVVSAASLNQQHDFSITRKGAGGGVAPSRLECLLDSEHCHLSLREVQVDSNSVNEEGNVVRKVIISLSAATNEPDLYTVQSINELFEFSPELGGLYGPAVGKWLQPDLLSISTSDEYIAALVAASAAGTAVVSLRQQQQQQQGGSKGRSTSDEPKSTAASNTDSLDATPVPSVLSGVFKLRFPQQGKYSIFVIDSVSKQVLSSVHQVHVKSCGDNVVPADLPRLWKHDNQEEERRPPRPVLRHSGVLAISGRHAVLVPQSVLPTSSGTGGGSFSVSFWLRLLEGPTGRFRAFFYKGDGNDPNRTPSAWLLPTSSRLAIRASTAASPDLGTDTTLSLPLDQWVHLCLVFDNRTRASGTSAFSAVVYVDGQLDISVGYSDEVVPNNSSLKLFKDVSFDGPRSFVADLVVWDSALTGAQVRTLAVGAATSNFRQWTEPVDLAAALMDGVGTSAARVSPRQEGEETPGATGSDRVSDSGDDLLSHEHFDLLQDSSPEPTSSPSSAAALAHLLTEIASAVESCEVPAHRLDLYAEAASLGHVESLYRWAMLIAFGAEKSMSKCGIESFEAGSTNVRYSNDIHPLDLVFDKANERRLRESGAWAGLAGLEVADQVKAAVALTVAAQAGYSAALVPLSTLLSTGVGLAPLLNDLHGTGMAGKRSRHILAHIVAHVPMPVNISFGLTQGGRGPQDCEEVRAVSCLPYQCREGVIVDSRAELFFPLPLLFRMSRVLRQSAGLETTTNSGLLGGTSSYKQVTHGVSNGEGGDGEKAVRRNGWIRDVFQHSQVEGYDLPLGDSVFSWNTHFSEPNQNDNSHLNLITKLASGLLLFAALDGHPDAIIALQKRYQHGRGGLEASLEVSAFYSRIAAITSADDYFKVGGQPIMENDRINDDTEITVLQGNTGKDDEVVQTYEVQASEGDVGSMLALGEMNYFGTRGIPRNQPRALEYYNQAAALGSVPAMCGAAGMYVKGEGTAKNVSRAVELYETAASQGSVRALNGLGFFHFHGDGVSPANLTKAYHYFLTATEQQDGDSDSWSNAAYCIEHGLGTPADPERAASFYLHAAKHFGHFGSIVAMGNMHYEGRGVARSSQEAVYYLGVANDIGPWMGWLRRGFDQFVQGGKSSLLALDADPNLFMRSALCYLHAGELGGYEVSQSNAAYLLQRRIGRGARQLYIGANLLEGRLASTKLVVEQGTADAGGRSQSHVLVSGTDLVDRLLLRELAMSNAQGNANSAYSIGTLLLAGRTGHKGDDTDDIMTSAVRSGTGSVGGEQDMRVEDAVTLVLDSLDKEYSIDKYLPASYLSSPASLSGGAMGQSALSDTSASADAFSGRSPPASSSSDARAAMEWFSRASAMNSALGSFQCGLMHHFGIGGVAPNPARASRYYSKAISNKVNPLHPSLRMMAQATQWLADGVGAPSAGGGGGGGAWFHRAAAEVVGWMARKMLL